MYVSCPNCKKVNRLRGEWAKAENTPVCGACRHSLRGAPFVTPPGAPIAPAAPPVRPVVRPVVTVVSGNSRRPHAGLVVGVAGALLVLILFGIFIWPTRYERGEYLGVPSRTDRLTGRVEVLVGYGRGWVPIAR